MKLFPSATAMRASKEHLAVVVHALIAAGTPILDSSQER
jgi:hypothetical protein